MNEQIIAKLRERIAQQKAQKTQTWAELQEKIKQRIAERTAEQAQNDK